LKGNYYSNNQKKEHLKEMPKENSIIMMKGNSNHKQMTGSIETQKVIINQIQEELTNFKEPEMNQPDLMKELIRELQTKEMQIHEWDYINMTI